ncbi:MAG: tyrosine--tRNA ligase [Candidatus Jorgensenbacteria bacterium]|nr:tyrosine--tRNA ligase [Candidatus Jorgensenbacteria bacterium]
MDKTKLIETVLSRGVEEIIDRSSLEKKLASEKTLRVKLGIDPTSPDIHLGHTVVLRKLRQFQDLGHKVVLIIGDFTAQIGDPSGKSETRPALSKDEVERNFKKYLKQAGKVIDIKKAEVFYNSAWYEKGIQPFLKLTRSATIQQVLKRDDFEKRMRGGNDISVLEILYPLFQGYDSVMVKADVELGGTDQKFNLLMGRRVQRSFGMPEQDVLTVPLIEGTDGVRKMSKSYGNYIALDDEPNDMFGKIMAVPDGLVAKYFTTLTDIDAPKNLGARDAKMLLAETIISEYHSSKDAKGAREEWIRVFSKKETPDDVAELKVSKKISVIDLLIKAGIESKSEARRLIEQGGVTIGDETKKDPAEVLNLRSGTILKIGKRRFFRIS